MSGGSLPVRVAAGPREAEREVMGWVGAHRPRRPEELARPVLVVVPSRSLRRHLLAALARELGCLAGVEVLTHRALARRVVERAGEAPPGGALTHEILVRRFAAGSPVLRETLGGLEDGYAAVAAAVRDLLDAGFGPESLEPAREALGEARGRLGGAAVERALAVLEVAAACAAAEGKLGIPRRGALLVRAGSLLAERGRDALGAGAVLIHGFAEATGLVSGLLERLVALGAEVVVDHPPDPAGPAARDPGWRFTERLLDRLLGPGRAAGLEWPGPSGDGPELSAFRAPGPEAEAREAAERIAELLEKDEPVDPTRVGIVARRLDVARLAVLRRQLGRLGIPFSGEGAGVPAGGAAARLRAVAELLARRTDASPAVWLAAAREVPGVPDPEAYGLALRAAGLGRLAEVAESDLSALCRGGAMPLPVVERLEEGEGGEPRRVRAAIPREALAAGRRAAAALAGLLAERPGRAPVGDHLAWVRGVLGRLGWRPGSDASEAVYGPLARLEAELETGLRAEWDELWPVLSRELRAGAAEPAGGRGGGVQLLSVMEARGRTFDHLFLLGLNRGEFPRQPAEDPVLPDAVRRALLPVLPDLPLKERGRIEDRYYFAQLLAAARHVTLSWWTVGADGAPANPSAFVERLRLAGRLPEPPAVRDVIQRPPDPERPRPLLEHAAAAGLAGHRGCLAAAAGLAGAAEPGHLAAVLEELDPDRPRDDLGPFLGLVGAEPPSSPWVTRLEAFARCPWRHHLERGLGLEPPPEPRLAGLPLRGALLGRAVHRALERLAAAAGAPVGAALEEVRGAPGVRLEPPGDAALRRAAAEAAEETAVEEGAPGLAPALAARAAELLRLARDAGWLEADRLLGAEVVGSCEAAGVTLRFRADRVERDGRGRLVLTDYKTGKVGGAKAPATLVARGEAIQGAAYALAGDLGRYLVLREGETDLVVTREDAAALPGVVETLLAAWRTGWMVPRLAEPEGGTPHACSFCEVREACLQGESGVRRRLAAAVEAAEEAPLGRLWRLPAAGKRR